MKSSKRNSEYLQQVSDKEAAVILEELEFALRKANGEENGQSESKGDSNYTTGDIVEFGCYRGDTSLLIEKLLEGKISDGANNDGSGDFTSRRNFWIYDSFEGLPARTREDASVAGDEFLKGELFVSKREVVERFKKAGLRVPKVRKGFFENLDPGEISASGEVVRSSNDLPDKIIFAFLDGDLYQSIKTSLNLVTPRLAYDANGKCRSVIIIHDYNNPKLPGVAKAVDEWVAQQSSDKANYGLMRQKTAPRLQRRETLAIISWL